MRFRPLSNFVALFMCAALALGAALTPTLRAQGGSFQHRLVYASPPAGWVTVTMLLVASGCSGAECSSTWTPGSEHGLFELRGDRMDRDHGQGDANPPGPPGSVADRRATCADGQLAAGTWYHNSTWISSWSYGGIDYTTTPPTKIWNETWTTLTWEGWNFAETDQCFQGWLTPTPPPTPTPDPSGCDLHCPGPTCDAPPLSGNLAYQPPYPVVVGQDPSRQGIELVLSGLVPPVNYHWYTRGQTRACDYGGWCGGTGPYPCDQTCNNEKYPKPWRDWTCEQGEPSPGPCYDDHSCERPGGKTGHKSPVCEMHTLQLGDEIDYVDIEAHLSQASRDWIVNDLSIRYPGAALKHPDYQMTRVPVSVIAGGVTTGTVGSGVWTGVVRLPVQDPGWWDIAVTVHTKGAGGCGPRVGTFTITAPAYLAQSTVIR